MLQNVSLCGLFWSRCAQTWSRGSSRATVSLASASEAILDFGLGCETITEPGRNIFLFWRWHFCSR